MVLSFTCSGRIAAQEDRLDRYQRQYEAEANPARRARLLGQMGPVEIARARTIYKTGKDEQALDELTHYRDEVRKTVDELIATGVDAVRKPAGFKELQIGLRMSIRQLDEFILTIPADKRPFFRGVRSDLADVQNKLIDLLFPRTPKSPTSKE